MSQDDRSTLTNEVSERLGISKVTVTRLIQRGELEAYKLTPSKNSPLRIYEDTVEALVERQRQQPKKP